MRTCYPMAVVCCFLVSCVRTDSPAPKKAEATTFTLYSIDGRDREPGKEVKAEETFMGYPVLGKVEIKDAASQRKVWSAFEDAYARRPKDGAKCFWPRHGIRRVEAGKTIELVICFECSWFTEYVDGKRLRHEPLNADVQPVFDKPLTDAGIPIAPK